VTSCHATCHGVVHPNRKAHRQCHVKDSHQEKQHLVGLEHAPHEHQRSTPKASESDAARYGSYPDERLKNGELCVS
jgi:hypothetical protein